MIAGVAIRICSPVRVDALNLDDFNNPATSGTNWTKVCFFGACGHEFTNGQAKLSVTPSGEHGFAGLTSLQQWTLREGRVLEFRVDLLSSSGDGAMARLNCAFGNPNKYMLFVDQDTIGLLKREQETLQLFFLTNGPTVKVTNVKLVLVMTGGPESSVLLHWEILDNDQAGRVLFEGSQRDTAGADSMVTGSHKSGDSPPGSFLGMTGNFNISLYHDNAGWLDPNVAIPPQGKAEVIFDNAEVLEYDAAVLDIQNSVLLTWSENTAKEQIVLAADSLTSANWTPWPEPMFKRFGGFRMAVPVTPNQQYFKLTSGKQFTDDFGNPNQPFANRNPWRLRGDLTADEFIITNGVLRVDWPFAPPGWPTPTAYQFTTLPPGSDVVVGNSYSSVDILSWEVSSIDDSACAIAARAIRNPDGSFHGGAAGLVLNPNGVKGDLAPWVSWAGSTQYGPTFRMVETPPPYRLQLSVVGPTWTLRVVSLATQVLIREMTMTSNVRNEGLAGLWIQAPPEATLKSHSITLDNFFVTGTTP